MATLYEPSGEARIIDPLFPPYYALSELQELVGGWIELVPLPQPDLVMVINEEGKLRELAPNPQATEISGLGPRDYIAGPAIVCRRDELEPDDKDGLP